MNPKTIEIVVDKTLKGIPINPTETNYLSNILISCDKDVDFLYAVVLDGEQDDESKIVFKKAKKIVYLKDKNQDGNYKKRLLVFKTVEGKCKATISIEMEQLVPSSSNLEQMNKGYIHNLYEKSYDDVNNHLMMNAETETVPWYKNPINIGIMVVVVLIFAVIFMKKSNKNDTGSLFID